MATDKPQQDAFLAAIEAKIAAWTAVADSYRAAVSFDGPLSDPGGNVAFVASVAGVGRLQGHDLPVGVFRAKSLKEAIPIYLGAVRRKQTNKEIALGLQAGGFPTTAENFEATVNTALYRLKNEGVLLRFPDGWDLASSYPDNLRGRLEKDGKPRGGRPKKTATKRRKPTPKPDTEDLSATG
ncbi:MAG TPA: hypothetical protein VNJ03_12525 [Vicinamibacterales bacterium]|nr:hypothetical protein [Vicinamibacterales bacterium]